MNQILSIQNQVINFYIFSGLSKTGIPFAKMQPRAPIVNSKTVAYVNNNSVVLDNIKKFESKISKFKSISSPKFEQLKGRLSLDPRIPLFMDGITSRMGLNILSRKMLETNHFDETYYFSKMTPTNRMIMTAGPGLLHKSQSQGSKIYFNQN